MRTDDRLGVCPSPAWWRVLAVTVAVGLVTAFSGVSSGLASAAVGPDRGMQLRAHAAAGSGLALAQAPAGLRVAVRRTLGLPSAGTCQQAELIAPHGAASDYFGISVAISGSTAVVGAYGRNSYTGAVYVFVRHGRTWFRRAELTAADGAAGDGFGISVAISGSTVVVGALWKANDGAVYVFVRSGRTWSQQAELAAPDGDAENAFGWSVAISGSTVVVGNGDNPNSGAVYVFVRSGTNWSQQAQLTADGSTDDWFGYSVAISGSTAVVGAVQGSASTPAPGSGVVYAFVRSGTTWSQQAELTAADSNVNDAFGWSVAISRSTMVVGAIGTNSATGALYVGAAYVFVRAGKTWSQQAELTAPEGAAYDNFGDSVAISGSTVVVGAFGRNSFTGAAYVFVRSGKTWSQRAKLTAADGATNDQLGQSVAISESTTVVGADGRNSYTGAVYVYRTHNRAT